MVDTERRKSPRFKISQMIGYFPNREEYLWAEGIDISRGGISCISKSPIDPLTNLYLMLSIPSSEGECLIRCEGYAAHSRMKDGQCHFGVRITRIEDEDRERLDAFITAMESEGFDEGSRG